MDLFFNFTIVIKNDVSEEFHFFSVKFNLSFLTFIDPSVTTNDVMLQLCILLIAKVKKKQILQVDFPEITFHGIISL